MGPIRSPGTDVAKTLLDRRNFAGARKLNSCPPGLAPVSGRRGSVSLFQRSNGHNHDHTGNNVSMEQSIGVQ